jgi:spore germination protein
MLWISLALAGVHEDQRLLPPAVPRPLSRPSAAPGPPPQVWVYGYWATWAGDLEDLDWARLTHVAIFWVDMESDGSVSATSNWTNNAARAMELAAPHGVKVHLTLTCFDDDVMASVLPSASKRTKLVNELGELVDAYGAHGVSVDCEGMSSSLKDDLVAFVEELGQRVDEVTVATPAIDWSGAYDYDALAYAGDALFIMGYGYHWSAGNPGPVAPLHGGDPWSAYSLEWSVEDYRTWGTPDDRIILGLPLYGRDWPTTSTAVPGSATGEGSAVTMVEAVPECEALGRQYDTVTDTPYCFPSSTHQLWYDDTESIEAKVSWAVEEELLGVGFWALNYEGGDPDFWDMMAERTGATDEPPEDSDEPGDSSPVDDSAPPVDSDGDGRGRVLGDREPLGSGCSLTGGPSSWLGLLGLLWLRRRGSGSPG